MQIFVITPNNKTLTINCDKNMTIEQVKHIVSKKTDLSIEVININYIGKLLDNQMTLEAYNIQAHSNTWLSINWNAN